MAEMIFCQDCTNVLEATYKTKGQKKQQVRNYLVCINRAIQASTLKNDLGNPDMLLLGYGEMNGNGMCK
jgi:hypothetical protein